MKYIYKFIAITYLFFFNAISHSAELQPGDLIISEVMANPLLSSDINGEWFEIFNSSSNPIDINGISISDDGSNFHQINTSLIINSGSYIVLGRNGDSNINGGYIADYVYSNFTLGNTSDQIILSMNDLVITRLSYSGLPFGSPGVSAELFAQTLMPNSSDYQLTENITYGIGDIGTPGSAGSIDLNFATPVPLPGALCLFASALLLLAREINLNLCMRNKINPIMKNFLGRFLPRRRNRFA